MHFNTIVTTARQLVCGQLAALDPADHGTEIDATVVGDLARGQSSLVIHPTLLASLS
jgi:hypothetical protein